MKRIIRICGLACMVGLLAFATSCKKDQETEGSSFTITMPQLVDDDDARVYVQSNGVLMWQANDQIRVYNLSDVEGQSQTAVFHNVTGGNKPRVQFQGPSVGPKKFYGYRFFYPVSMTKALEEDLDHNRETFVIPHEQQYAAYPTGGGHDYSLVDVSSMPMAVDPAKITSSCNLEHMFGVLRVYCHTSVDVDKYVESVVLHDNVWSLWGEVSVNLHRADRTKLWNVWNTYKAEGNTANYATVYANYVLAGDDQEGLGWVAVPGDPENHPEIDPKELVLNCMVNGQGVKLKDGVDGNYTCLAFMLRPLALSEGFSLTFNFTEGEPKTFEFPGEYDDTERYFCIKPAKFKNVTINEDL